MRILLVHNYYREPGGEDVVFAQERDLLQRKGHHVVIYTRSNEEALATSSLDSFRLLTTSIYSHQAESDITRIIRDEKPDLAHIHNTFMMISPGIFKALSNAKVPAVHTIHNYRLLCPASFLYRDGRVCEECTTRGLMSGVRHGCYRNSRVHTAAVALMLKTHRIAGTWTRHVEAFIALTQFARHKLLANGFPAERVHVKSNFIDRDPGQRQGPGEYALFVGRLSPEKGLRTLINAWSRMAFPVPLRIIGDGPEREQLEAHAHKSSLPHIQFLGRLDHDQTTAAMKNATFLVLPSLWYEGFPMVLVESFACAVPVLASRLGAMEELIADGVSGLHFTAGSAEDLANKASWAWDHATEMMTMGRNARSTYESKYGPEQNYSTLMDIYKQALRPSTVA